MTEAEAKAWVDTRYPAAVQKLSALADLVRGENERQNLVASSTLDTMWSRHLTDSVQLVALAEDRAGVWVDVGTGGGFPGLAVAAVRCGQMVLVEPRRRRAEFLARAANALELPNVDVRVGKIEQMTLQANVISARAVATTEGLLTMAGHMAGADTLWLLPRGRVEEREYTMLRRRKMVFHVERSVTAASEILVIGRDRI